MAKAQSQVTGLDDDTDVVVDTFAKSTVEPKVTGSGHDAQMSGEKVTITMQPSDSEYGDEAVTVSVNGVAYQLPRGVPCRVPVEVEHALKNAQTTRYQAMPGGAVKESVSQRFSWFRE